MPAVIAAVAVIALTVTVAGPVLIAAANGDTVVNMLDCIKKLIQQIRERAPGMPKPPPGRSKKDMKKAAQELGLKYKYYNFGFCGPQGADDEAPRYLRLWDIPGCGTIGNRIQNYFNDNHLYVFDCLLMITQGILGEYELRILNEAGACNTPIVIVLSKSELKAESKARCRYDRKDMSATEYQPIVEDTINEAKQHMLDTINKAQASYKSIKISRVFVVSAVKFRDFLKTHTETDALLAFETSELLSYLVAEAKNKRVA
ncbi:unnamed protein product [Rotaria socialis]|uniref:IRG-type G domain-containing protein n=1 Tax=Rotaria socialis TaxID=392032 RepID=A0A820GEG1_9BILA|nr:unnamed protein product [Rotaria socialis]